MKLKNRTELAEYFARLGFKKGAEIGVRWGYYSETLCKTIPGLDLLSIDIWKNSSEFKEAKKRLSRYSSRLIRKSSTEALGQVKNNSLDFVYIDADHSYKSVLEDITGWTKKVRAGGIVAGHDYYIFKHSKNRGVIDAVDEFTTKKGYKLYTTDWNRGPRDERQPSWYFFKNGSGKSMLGKWDGWYKNLKVMGSFKYGNTETYRLAEKFLRGLDVEDWGCGAGGFKKIHKGGYVGIDGSATPFADRIADLRKYRSSVDGIMMRHVLEHNYDWERVLKNALFSFQKRLCIIIFTPFSKKTKVIAQNKKYGVDVPDISFAKSDLEKHFNGISWKLSGPIKTNTHYKTEHIYYLEK